MATLKDQTTAGPPKGTETFKGHPQPNADERLKEARDYLADEDVNRNLGFKGRLTQIEEYIKDLEEKGTPCEKNVFQDVKTMAVVQREWMDNFMDAPPCDKKFCDPSYIAQNSTRLISKEAGRELLEEREAFGLRNQMREDHAPFTVERGADHIAFLERLKKDESENPETIDEQTNLLWVENRAYGWALTEPSLIPVWLHPRKGLPNKGIRLTDESPWYRPDGNLPPRASRRPPPQKLPDHLQQAQDTINDLLKKYTKAGEGNFEDLKILEGHLSQYELPSLKRRRKDLEETLERYPEPFHELHDRVKEKVTKDREEVDTVLRSWLSSFAKDGIQLMVGEQPATHILQPGVFCLPAGAPSADDDSRLKRIEDRVNAVLRFTPEQLHDHYDERNELISYFEAKWPPDLKNIVDQSLTLVQLNQDMLGQQNDDILALEKLRDAQLAFLQQFLGQTFQLRHQLPGQLSTPEPNVLYSPWNPGTALPAQPSIPLPKPTENLEELRRKINATLRGIDSYTERWGTTVPRPERRKFEMELVKVMPPHLRHLRETYLDKAAEHIPSPENDQNLQATREDYTTVCESWVDSFLHRGIREIRVARPFQLDETPWILYLRDPNADPTLIPDTQTLKEICDNINQELRTSPILPNDPEDQSLYISLKNLQYPKLKEMDKAWREKANVSDPTAVMIREQQHAKKKWRKAYNFWVYSLQGGIMEVRLPSSLTDDEGDPSVVYYRGPLRRDDSNDPATSPLERPDPPLTRRQVDHALLMLIWHGSWSHDSQRYAEELAKVSCLPPSVLKRLHNLQEADKNTRAEKRDEFDQAFSAWEELVREWGRPPPVMPAVTSSLPAKHGAQEKIINNLLNADSLTEADLGKLNDAIEPYWKAQLDRLRHRRKVTLLLSGRWQESTISRLDMSISTFTGCFESFKTKCRARGFKIIQDSTGRFVAQDPEAAPSMGDRRRLEDILRKAENYPSRDWDFENMNTNEIIDELYNRQQDINQLLSIHIRDTPDLARALDNRSRNLVEDAHLIELLRPLFPPHLTKAYNQCAGRGAAQFAPNSGTTPAARTDPVMASNIQHFLDIYEPWIRKLQRLKRGVRLVLASKYGAGQVTDKLDGVLYVERSPILEHGPEEDDTSDLLSSDFRGVQLEINQLLGLGLSKLSLTQQKRLRVLLRTVMPKGLAETDKTLRTLSQLIRGVANSDDEFAEAESEYIPISSIWKTQYYSWLDSFANKGVRLKRKVNGDPPNFPPTSNIMYVQIESMDELPDETNDMLEVPRYVKRGAVPVNRFLQYDRRNEKAGREFRRHMRLLFKPTADIMRQQLLDKYNNILSISPQDATRDPSSSVLAAVEAEIQNSLAVFRESVLESPEILQIKFVEVSPETFEGVLYAPNPTGSSRDDERLMQKLTHMAHGFPGRDIPAPQLAGVKEFSDLSQKVRDRWDPHTTFPAPALTDDERETLDRVFQPLSRKGVRNLESDVRDLTREQLKYGNLSKADEDLLKDLTVQQLWHWYGTFHPDIRAFALESVNPPDPVETLIDPMVRGARRSSALAPAPIDPPTESDILTLETRVDDLLAGWKNLSLRHSEHEELGWLLRPLLDPDLKSLDGQINELRWKEVEDRDGWTTNDMLRLDNLRTEFFNKFWHWVGSIERFGVLLDTWWFNHEAMLNLWRHYKMWQDNVEAHLASQGIEKDKQVGRRGSGSSTSSKPQSQSQTLLLETENPRDQMLRDKRRNAELLRQFAENYEGTYQDRLLLEYLPPLVKSLYGEIHSLRDQARSRSLGMDESIHLRTLTEDFVRLHMNWYTNLSPIQIQTWRGNTVDFSAKAERRGVQRAAIELGLNLLATNQEQHRPNDRFRRVALPQKYQPPPEEVALWKPLDPWKRPIELDPFHYTKLIQKFRGWKEDDYSTARTRVINESPGNLAPPANYNGPFTVKTLHGMQETIRKRHNHLGQIVGIIERTSKVAPRPLLDRLCILMLEAILQTPGTRHILQDDTQLTMADLNLLMELCEPSWNNALRPWGPPGSMAGFPDADPDFSAEVARLEEFARDVESATVENEPQNPLLPFWRPRHPRAKQTDPSSAEFFTETQYSKNLTSSTGISVDVLQQSIGTARLKKAADREATVHMWSKDETKTYLQVMHDCGRIHLDGVTKLVSRIPPSGHPEHKYVLSEDDAKKASYIHFNKTTNKYEVQYDVSGNTGTPTVQPNKYKHLQHLAFRLGRDFRLLAEAIADDNADESRYAKQSTALDKTLRRMEELNPAHAASTIDPATGKELSLKMIARDLVKYAKELRDDIGMDPTRDISTITTEEAAKIIQLQLIEESNNNWESRFPEDEHVWDWVDDPLLAIQPPPGTAPILPPRNRPPPTRQYFSLRRWPVEYQSLAVQAMIKTSEPAFAPEPGTSQKTQPTPPVPVTVAAQRRRNTIGPYPRERYTGRGGPPNFPFGETPYQQAFQSFRIEEDLKDVEEFRRPAPPTGALNNLKRKLASPEPPPVDRFALPEIPAHWNPTNVSVADKNYDIIEKAKKTEGLPDTDDAYYHPDTLAEMNRRRASNHARNERERARAEIVKHVGKPYNQLTRNEIREWQDKLNIDPLTEQFRPTPKTVQKPAKGPGKPKDFKDPKLPGNGGGPPPDGGGGHVANAGETSGPPGSPGGQSKATGYGRPRERSVGRKDTDSKKPPGGQSKERRSGESKGKRNGGDMDDEKPLKKRRRLDPTTEVDAEERR